MHIKTGKILARRLSVITLSGLAAFWVAGSVITKARKSAHVTPSSPPSQDIILTASDGVSLAGTYTPGRTKHAPAVLLLHGLCASREKTAANAAWLSHLGYATLTIDFRGHGQSDVRPCSFGYYESLDAQTAFAWLKNKQNNAPVGIIGISLGGAACLIGKDGVIEAEALILQAVYPDIRRAIKHRVARYSPKKIACFVEPFLSFQAPLRFGVWPRRLSPLRALPQYHGAVLVIGGEQDRSTPLEETQELFAAAKGEKELFLVSTGDHPAICNLADPVYRERIEAFLKRTIGNPDTEK